MVRILEICVDTIASLEAARAGGADRIELCSALGLGGLTPSPGLIALAAQQPLPCHAMVRPHAGAFAYDTAEVAQMEGDIAAIASAGLAGVVFGATRGDTLDAPVLERLIGCATQHGLTTTLHRAIDTLSDPVAAIDTAIALGFDRVLSSGGASHAIDGRVTLQAMRARAGDAITLMAGSGIDANNVDRLLAIGIDEIHASCAHICRNHTLSHLGLAAPRHHTSADRVRALREAIDK
ncbi:copper homeostasis protein CutC [Hephaestia sp. GCM10023244]|uniref:copper homeostasis protein CutC n=1 Tax=unclassified Hephaestia TaxID=2631281 RepID=UPI0020774D1B|nr:copper homeostasis protein CutC [Hephaestia sp. MAHUQ-44]MCM8730314.1 copper homeostasis protein CutC [Hephaestia sp. MAHUQ-44]